MRFISRSALVALMAVFAMSAVAAGSAAAALPEFVGSFPTKYKFSSGGFQILENGFQVGTCGEVTGEGSITGAKALAGKFAFKGCHTALGEQCTSAGASAGEIRTGELQDILAYISQVPKEAAVVFNSKGGTLATFVCSGGGGKREGVFRGGIITRVSPVDTKVKELLLHFNVEAGVQAPTEYENEAGKKVRLVPEISLGSKTFSATGFGLEGTPAFSHFESGGKSVEVEVKD